MQCDNRHVRCIYLPQELCLKLRVLDRQPADGSGCACLSYSLGEKYAPNGVFLWPLYTDINRLVLDDVFENWRFVKWSKRRRRCKSMSSKRVHNTIRFENDDFSHFLECSLSRFSFCQTSVNAGTIAKDRVLSKKKYYRYKWVFFL